MWVAAPAGSPMSWRQSKQVTRSKSVPLIILGYRSGCLPKRHVLDDGPEQNLNPVGRLYYAGSTMICPPTSLSQQVGVGLGAQAGEARLREIITSGGFSKVRRANETPFNILEARP
jgi:hypothetical protein